MNIHEFKTQDKYLLQLKDEKQDKDATPLLKSKEFYSLLPLLLQKYPDAYIRDYLEVDGTFAIAFSSSKEFKFREALDLHGTLIDTLKFTTYTEVVNEGFVEIPGTRNLETPPLVGFWVLLQ